MLVEIVGYGEKLRCLWREVRLPDPLLLCRLLLYLFLFCHLFHILRLKQLFIVVSIASASLPLICLRIATALDGIPINIFVSIEDVVVSLRVLVGSIDLLSVIRRPLITVALVVLVLNLFFLQRARPESLPLFRCLNLRSL